MQYTYKVNFFKEPDGGYTVSVPLLPGCIIYGETMDQAVNMAKDAIALYIESLMAHGEPIPSEEHVFEHLISVAV